MPEDPALVGRWEVLPNTCPINPIHAALLRTNKVLFIAGSGNDPNNTNDTDGSAVFDNATGTFTQQITPVDANGKPYDLFCVGHSFLSDGNLFAAGGTLQYDPFLGLPNAFIFNTTTEQWSLAASMAHGRWYPTQVTLGNGRVLAVSGTDENGATNRLPEIYNPATNSWIGPYPQTNKINLYASLFLLRDGRIFYAGIQFGRTRDVPPTLLTLPTDPRQPIAEVAVPGIEDADFSSQGASVLLPPAQDQKVMVLGGGDVRRTLPDGSTNPTYLMTTKRVNIVDLKSSSPRYTPAAPMNFPRMHLGAVILPDRTVFVCGGSQMSESSTQLAQQAEIYNPATNTWTLAATATVPRLYHSLALLLPDGRVLTAGGNPRRTTQERRLEIYSPPYLFKSTRPTIQSAPQSVRYGGTFTIQTPQASSIRWVNLIRPMAVTHSCDTEQRLVNVGITARDSTSLTVRVTSNRNEAPPGWYMLSITDQSRIPSVATWIQLT